MHSPDSHGSHAEEHRHNPATPTIHKSVAATQQFVATGTYSDGSTQVIMARVTWTSSKTTVATIARHSGLATGAATGTITIKGA